MLNVSWFLTGLIVGMVFVFAMYEYQFRRAFRRAAFRDKLSQMRSYTMSLLTDPREMWETLRRESLNDYARHELKYLFGGAVRGI